MVRTQLIAHDKEVFDIAFSRAGGGRDIFASVGADGSVRMFDLRLVRTDWDLKVMLSKSHCISEFDVQVHFVVNSLRSSHSRDCNNILRISMSAM